MENAITSCNEACHFLDFIKDETTGHEAQKHFLKTVGTRVVETMWQSDEEEGSSEDDDDEHNTESDEEPASPPQSTLSGAKALVLIHKARAGLSSDSDAGAARPSKKARA